MNRAELLTLLWNFMKPYLLLSMGFKHNPLIQMLSVVDRDRLLNLYFLRNEIEGDFSRLSETEIAYYLGCALPDLVVTRDTLFRKGLINEFMEPIDCEKLNHNYNRKAKKQKDYRERQKAKMLAKKSLQKVDFSNKKPINSEGASTASGASQSIKVLLGNALR